VSVGTPPPTGQTCAVNYPVSLRHLSSEVRDKAVEIANALLAKGYDDGMAIRIGIAQAKRWAGAINSRGMQSFEWNPRT